MCMIPRLSILSRVGSWGIHPQTRAIVTPHQRPTGDGASSCQSRLYLHLAHKIFIERHGNCMRVDNH